MLFKAARLRFHDDFDEFVVSGVGVGEVVVERVDKASS